MTAVALLDDTVAHDAKPQSPAKRADTTETVECYNCEAEITDREWLARGCYHYAKGGKWDVWLCRTCSVLQPDGTSHCEHCNASVAPGSDVYTRDIPGVNEKQEPYGRVLLTHAECRWHCGGCWREYDLDERETKLHCVSKRGVLWCADCAFRCVICNEWALHKPHRDETAMPTISQHVPQGDDDTKVLMGVHIECARVARERLR